MIAKHIKSTRGWNNKQLQPFYGDVLQDMGVVTEGGAGFSSSSTQSIHLSSQSSSRVELRRICEERTQDSERAECVEAAQPAGPGLSLEWTELHGLGLTDASSSVWWVMGPNVAPGAEVAEVGLCLCGLLPSGHRCLLLF